MTTLLASAGEYLEFHTALRERQVDQLLVNNICGFGTLAPPFPTNRPAKNRLSVRQPRTPNCILSMLAGQWSQGHSAGNEELFFDGRDVGEQVPDAGSAC